MSRSFRPAGHNDGGNILTFKLLDHKDIPTHEVISGDELEAVLKMYGIGKEQLPKIRDDDPVIKEIDAKVGDVVRITRKSQTAEEALFYRLVIESIA